MEISTKKRVAKFSQIGFIGGIAVVLGVINLAIGNYLSGGIIVLIGISTYLNSTSKNNKIKGLTVQFTVSKVTVKKFDEVVFQFVKGEFKTISQVNKVLLKSDENEFMIAFEDYSLTFDETQELKKRLLDYNL
ncbi:hypothetical protein [Flammeovirga aprica]|uniref:Uncharacterized protein n=1 Tax=Flammeovirga aprica JL-4 TaxID=694437 RepID=A0A7X9RZJ0_9BACT|nr:hypothetical protein [Flammeovirga aprica]NME71588.1 hypothetical protein [Flammeovirga aprica JL-4]